MSDTTPQEAPSGQSADQTPNTGPTMPAARQRSLPAAEAPMRCADARPYLSAYADGELAESLRPLVAAHIAGCAECRALVQRAQTVDRLLASLPHTAPSPEVYERVQAAVARRGLDPVVREPLRSARWAQEIGGVSARAVKRLLTPRVVYPQEPDHEDDGARPAGAPIPFQRRAPWVVGALPAIAALLLISLSLALFSGLAWGHKTGGVVATTTPSAQVGAGLHQAEVALQQQESNVSFRPVMPTYLPSGAYLSKLTADKSADTLIIIWAFAATSGVQQIALREAQSGQGFADCQGSSAAFGAGNWLQWELPDMPTWTALTCAGRTDIPAVGQHRPALDIALSVTPRAPAKVDNAVGELRITSLSMDTDYQTQVSFLHQLGAHPQPNTNLYLHFDATATDQSGQTYVVKGETNTPFIQAAGHREERNTVVGGRLNQTDIVNGSAGVRFYSNNASTYQTLTYPAQSLLDVGRDGEPGADAMFYFNTLKSSMQTGVVWVVTTHASLNNRQMVELAVVNAAVATSVYVDAKTYAVTQVSVTTGSSPGGTGAQNRLATSNVDCPGTDGVVVGCSLSYSSLWITTKPTSPNDFSLTPPVATANGRALTFHLKQSDKQCQKL